MDNILEEQEDQRVIVKVHKVHDGIECDDKYLW